MPVDSARAKTLFLAAAEIADADQRRGYLDRECAGDPELRDRVEALLKADAGDGTGAYTPNPEKSIGTGHSHTAGDLIAERYKLRQQIGEGGMGTVWMADQTEPVKRKVAVKLIRVERGQSKTILARFEAERQAIALMDHPHIAKLLDAGTTDTGSPYFVMELVKGVPLNEFCDQHKLTIPERLNLFTQICSAVQHAHQKGIIHRDLKPTNILVESHDGKPVPKVIDFGLAKAASGLQLTEQSMFTAFGSVMGTPLYMAPEQANFNAVDVDTRADVYALGVILYEMLTGTTPITRETLKKAAIDEMLRMVREQEAPTPSSRLSSADSAPSVAANRQIEPQKLGRFVKGELDWIVMKALSKERDRRYETANGFAKDIERFLNHEPVSAGPPSASYKLRKFVQRNRGQVIAASLVLFALVAGIVGTTLGLVEAKHQQGLAKKLEGIALAAAEEEKLARQREEERAEGEKSAKLDAQANLKQATENLAFAKKGNEILGSVFAGLDPKKNYATVGEFSQALKDNLTKAVKELEGSAIGDPLTVAEMQMTLGSSLLALGDAKLAVEVFEKALATRKAKLGPDHPDTLQSMNNLAAGYRDVGQHAKALPLFEETLARKKARLGPDHPDTLLSMNNLAAGYQNAGDLDKSLELVEETHALMKARFGPDHPSTLISTGNLAVAYAMTGKLDRARPLLEDSLKHMKAKLGPDHPITLRGMGLLASCYCSMKQFNRSVPLFEELLPLQEKKLGRTHPDSQMTVANLAANYKDAGRVAEAIPLFEESIKLMQARLGPGHPETFTFKANLASCYQDAGMLEKALPLFEETLALTRAKLGPDHPHTFLSINNLASCYWSLQQLDKSVPMFEELLPLQQKKLGRDHPNTLLTIANLGVNYKDAGRIAEAIPLLEEVYQASKKHPHLRTMGTKLLDAYAKAGKSAEGAKLIDELLVDARKTLPKDSPQLAGQLAQYGVSLLEMKGYAEAEPLLRECFAIREKTQPDVWTTFNTQSMLGGALLGQKKYTDAEPMLVKGYEGMKAREKTIPPQGSSRIPEALGRLIEMYTATNKPDEVTKYKELQAKYPAKPPEPKK